MRCYSHHWLILIVYPLRMREEGGFKRDGINNFLLLKKKAGRLIREGRFIWERKLCRLFKVFQKVWTIRAGTIFLNFCLKLGMPSLQSYGLYCYCDEINFTHIAKFGAALSYSTKTLFPGFLPHQFLREIKPWEWGCKRLSKTQLKQKYLLKPRNTGKSNN